MTAAPTSSVLSRITATAPNHALWPGVQERCQRIGSLLGDLIPLTELGEREMLRLARVVKEAPREHLGGVTSTEAIAEISRIAGELDPTRQAALYGELLRGIDPVQALDAASTDYLFSAEELSLIAQLEDAHPPCRPHLPRVQWSAGEDVVYEGYVCAIVKVTRQCNLRCGYCHDWRTGPEARMKFEVMANVIARLLRCQEHAAVDFVWHGGEPTLMGKREFLRVLALQNRFRSPAQRVVNILQTNATAITDDWAQFLSDFRFRVSVSLDGPPEIHDQSRPMASGRSSYEHTRRGLSLLRKYGLAQAVLVVVGDAVVKLGAEALIRFLQEEGLTKVALLAVRPDNPPTASSTPYLSLPRFARFLADIQRARLDHPEPWVGVRELDSLLALQSGSMPTLCEHLGNCVGHYFAVEPNGDVSHCDKYLGDPEFLLGNLLHDGFDAIRSSEQLARVRVGAERSRAGMQSCRHFAKCRGWCPHERYVAKRMRLGVQPKCCGLGPVFEALEGAAGVPT